MSTVIHYMYLGKNGLLWFDVSLKVKTTGVVEDEIGDGVAHCMSAHRWPIAKRVKCALDGCKYVAFSLCPCTPLVTNLLQLFVECLAVLIRGKIVFCSI